MPGGKDRLSRVFDDGNSGGFCDRHNRIHVGGTSKEVHRHDGAATLADLPFYIRWTHQVGEWVDVCEDWNGPESRDSTGCGKERVARQNHFIAWLDIK